MLNSWRDQILREFAPNVARLTLVADPDGLLLEEGVLAGIRERGFELIPFEDHVAFRYAYESQFRSRWDQGEQSDLAVVLHSAASGLGGLPYDLLQAGRWLSFNLGEIFPNLSYPIVTALDRGELDALYEAQKRHAPGVLGDNATKEFVLRHVFEIAPELIRKPSELMRALLRRHYRGLRIPAILDQRFIQVLRQNGLFGQWPLDKITSDSEAFFSFLQERWPAFLDRMAAQGQPKTVGEDKAAYGLQYSGPLDLPFDHDDVRVYIDNLFIEGLLHSVSHDNAGDLTSAWVEIGIQTDPAKDHQRRLDRLIKTIRYTIPKEDARHADWFRFGYAYAEISVLEHELGSGLSSDAKKRISALRLSVDSAFRTWVQDRFAGLHNQPPVPPAMLHHIPRVLARAVCGSREKKAAFLLVDGLALEQWIVLRDVLQSQRQYLTFRESAVFAWIPTVTSVSRQAAFAGKPPIYFPARIHTTNREQTLWTQFWADQGLTGPAAAYAKGLGDGDIGKVREILSQPQIRVAGLVLDKVDKIMHGMELGVAGMLNQVRQWAMQGFMAELIDTLLDQGFQIFLSSDHGNIEAKGCGRPAEGAVADVRGERVRVYPDDLLRAAVKERFPDAIEWPPLGLPEDYRALLAPHRKAFISDGETIVGHGGISIEELIVPLIQIERRET
ncbi:MAG: alkaline phosphatase [spirochete symbiont of Stewartia floridana]|nr:MAG: alkaline phosphatase [spirochete symbiont of Stewartia floridana]